MKNMHEKNKINIVPDKLSVENIMSCKTVSGDVSENILIEWNKQIFYYKIRFEFPCKLLKHYVYANEPEYDNVFKEYIIRETKKCVKNDASLCGQVNASFLNRKIAEYMSREKRETYKSLNLPLYPETSIINLDKRNVATSRLAGYFGIERLVAQSKSVEISDECWQFQGNLMNEAAGLSGNQLAKLDDLKINSPNLMKAMSILQSFDFICGQGDRNSGNIVFTKNKNEEYDSVIAIDNELAFPMGTEMVSSRITDKNGMVCLCDNNFILPAIDQEWVYEVLACDYEQIWDLLQDVLITGEIESCIARIKKMQCAFIKLLDDHEEKICSRLCDWNYEMHLRFMNQSDEDRKKDNYYAMLLRDLKNPELVF